MTVDPVRQAAWHDFYLLPRVHRSFALLVVATLREMNAVMTWKHEEGKLFVSSLRSVSDRWLIKLQAERVGILQRSTTSHLVLVVSIHADISGLGMHDIYCPDSGTFSFSAVHQ